MHPNIYTDNPDLMSVLTEVQAYEETAKNGTDSKSNIALPVHLTKEAKTWHSR